MRISVIGGTGLVGAKLVATLRHRGHEVVVGSRRCGVDTLTGEGLNQAIAGSRVVIDVTNSPTWDDDSATKFFETSSRNLVASEIAARAKHHIVLSVVGTDRLLDSAYFKAKMLQEDLVRGSPIPHTILRSTQFFDFLRRIPAPHLDGSAVRVSPAFVQPIAADEVAAAIADLAQGEPRNDMIEHAGPEVFHLHEIVGRVMEAAGDGRAVIADSRARYFGAELSVDSLTPDEGAIIGVTRFDEWLKQHASTLRTEVPRIVASALRKSAPEQLFH
jgi:Predicted nucleoside-diphosphate-sugar epimerases